MEIGGIQTGISLTVIAGAAALALVCDYLRARNQQLREEMAALKARRQREQSALPATPRTKKSAECATEDAAVSQRIEKAGAIAHSLRPEPGFYFRPGIAGRAAGAALPVESEHAENRGDCGQTQVGPVASETATPIHAQAAASALPPVEIDESAWRALLGIAEPGAAPRPAFELIPFELIPGAGPASAEWTVPGGIHNLAVFSRLLENRKPFTGVAASIAVNGAGAHSSFSEDLLPVISAFIPSLLRPGDFACRTAADEFIVICPGVCGAAAQRRLSRISEQLWDFQLRSIGAFPILFSWGGVATVREPLAEAVFAAKERMDQIRRSRAAIPFESARRRRRAV